MGNKDQDVGMRNKSYNEYVESVTPKASCFLNCVKAFVTGGSICVVGQLLLEFFKSIEVTSNDASLYVTISLVLISVILTGFGIYPLITTFGGAGSLVPITGFANSVAAPAIEYKKEGQIFGIGCKIFTIAGPVIMYGICLSWLVGLMYWILKILAIKP